MSCTVTVNRVWAVLLKLSDAVQVTVVVVSRANVDPEAGAQVTAALCPDR